MIHRNLAIALVSAGGYIGGALALKAAEKAGYIPHEETLRAFQVFSGLALAVYANFLPKSIGTFRDPASAMCMQSILRVSGWAYMLGGLAFALASLLRVPDPVPAILILVPTGYAMGYCVWAVMQRSTSRPG